MKRIFVIPTGPPVRKEGSTRFTLKLTLGKLDPSFRTGGPVGMTKIRFIRVLLFIHILFQSCQHPEPLFRELPAEQTGITFQNTVRDTDSVNILTYIYFYNGGSVAAGDLNNDGLADLFFTANHRGGNRLYLNRGNKPGELLRFEDITANLAGTADWTTGVTLTDVNADGRLDLYVCTVNEPSLFKSVNQLFINEGNDAQGRPRFSEQAARYGLDFRGHSTQAVFFDYDHDTDLDCFLLNHSVTMRDDYRAATARQETDSASGDQLLENRAGRFVNVTRQAGIYSSGIAYGLGVSVGDLNGDGWDDIYVGNDFREHDYAYINLGNGRFREAGTELFAHHSRFSMGCDIADYTNDGRADLVTADMLPTDERVLKSSLGDDEADTYDYKQGFGFHYQVSRNTLQTNLGGNRFSDRALMLGVAATDWSWTPLLADFTNDGRKDLFISNGIQQRTNDLDFARFVHTGGNERQLAERRNLTTLIKEMPEGAVPDVFFEQTETGQFHNRSAEVGFSRPTLSNGTAYVDLDNDGDLDLVVNRVNEPAGIYENQTNSGGNPSKNYLQLSLHGPGQNRFALGAQVDVWAGGQHQHVQQMLTRGFLSAVWPVLHVGLGTATQTDSVVIRWPTNPVQRQVLRQVKGGQRLVVTPPQSDRRTALPRREGLAEAQVAPPSPFFKGRGPGGGVFHHRENPFNDFANQPLIPHKLSTQGPHLAVADLNNDGLDDFFVGGAANQAGALFVQERDGRFTQTNQAVFAADSACEDVDALFFDADNDRDLDLYVASGGNEHFGTDARLNDRLYLNRGLDANKHPVFQKSTMLPALFENKSCVRAADFDRDGDLDLFVGGRANARLYGATPTSVLLRNNGTRNAGAGLFTAEAFPLGMVTDAQWVDLDRDTWPDLVVVGHWMPITILKNNRGHLDPPVSLPQTNGWWNCLLPMDLDRDGDLDLLAGNWGLNSKLTASAENPLRLHLADPDHNGEQDPILTIVKGAREYPFLGRDKLERRFPYLKKRSVTYRAVAGLSIQELFGDGLVNARVLEVNTLASSILWNKNGTLVPEALPAEVQTAPVFSFAQMDPQTVVAGGNFYGVLPYEGRYDALPPTILRVGQQGVTVSDYLFIDGEIRDLKRIRRVGHGSALLVARNNAPLLLYELAR